MLFLKNGFFVFLLLLFAWSKLYLLFTIQTQRHSKTITTKKHDRFSQDTKTPTKTHKNNMDTTQNNVHVQRYDRVLTTEYWHSKRITNRKKHRKRRCRRNSKQELSKTTQSCMSTLHTRGQNVPYKVQQKNVTRKSKHSKFSAQRVK